MVLCSLRCFPMLGCAVPTLGRNGLQGGSKPPSLKISADLGIPESTLIFETSIELS